jgi:transcriptional regulator with XRE-family HTH domain
MSITKQLSEAVMSTYYRRIRELREDHDKTQREIAELLGMKQPQYLRYEQGKRDIPTVVLRKLCQLYGVSADYILELPKNLKWPR